MNYILSFFTSIFIVLIVNSEGEDIINLCPNGVFKCVSAKSLRICFHGQLVTSEFFCPNSTYCSEVADTICTQLEPITPSTDKSTITETNSDSPNTRSTTQRFPETNSTNSDLISESTIVTRTSSNTDSHTHNDIETTSSATQGSTKTEEESSTTEELTTVIPECTNPGRFPILNTKCTKYILCVGTSHGFEQKIYTCPGNSTFDPLAQKCKLYNYCPEITTTIAPTIGPSICTEAGKFPVSNTKCTEYILCVLTSNGFVQHIYKCPDNTTFDPLSKRCNTYYACPENIPPTTTEVPTDPTESPKCTEAGKFPVSNTYCTEYILCVLTSNGFVHHTYKCPDNTTFDPLSKRCQMYYTCSENIPSTTTEVSSSTTEASKCTEAGKFPVSNTNCTEYILCVITSNGFVHHSYKCPDNTTFDPLSQKCKMYYTCPENLPPTTTETVPTGTTEIPICTEAGKFPVPNTNCTQFLLCVATSNGLMHQVFPCPDNTTFDPVAKKCKTYYECKEHLSSTTSTEPGTTVTETPTKPVITTVKDTPTEPTTDLNTSTEPVTKTTVRDTPTEPAPTTTGKDTSTELVTTETSIVGTSTESVTTTTVQNTPKETAATTTTVNDTPTESVTSTTVKDTSTEAVTTTTVEETPTEPETGTTVQNTPTESTTKSTIIDTSTESAVTTTTSKNTPTEPLTTTTELSTTTSDLNTPTEPPTKTTVKDEITKPIATTTTTTKNTATEPVITTTELLTTPTVQNTTTEPATKTTVKDDLTEPAATSTTVRVTSTEAVPTTTDEYASTKPTTIQSTSAESATETTVGDYLTESTVTTAESTPTEPVTSTTVEETTTESSTTTIVQNTPTESSRETTESVITTTTVRGTSTELPNTTEFETTTVDENTQTEPAATITTGKDISTVTTESGTTVTASTTVKDTTINPLTTTTLQSSPDEPATTTVTDSPTESAATTTTIGNTVTELVITTTTESAITTTIQNIPTEPATELATETTVTDSPTESAATTTIGNTVTELVTTTTTESATTTIQNIPTEPATETTVTDSPTEPAATTTTIGNTVTELVTTTTTESAITTTIQNTPTEPGTETTVTYMPTESAASTTAVENIPTEPVTTTTTIKNTSAEPATESTVTDTQTEPGASITTVENIPTELVTTTTTIQNTPTEPATESTVIDTQTEPGVTTTTVENIPTEVITTTTTIQNTPTESATETSVEDTPTEPAAITTTKQDTTTEATVSTTTVNTPTEPPTPMSSTTKTIDTGTSTVPPQTTVKNSPTEPAETTPAVPESTISPTVQSTPTTTAIGNIPTEPSSTTTVEDKSPTTVKDTSPTTDEDTTTEQVTSTSTVTTPSTLPECTKMGRFPVVNTNCTKYILCILTSQGYLRNEYECPPNSYFDPSVQRCNSFYVCPENPPTTPSTTEVTNPNDSQKCSAAGRFPVPNSNCTKYSLCSITSHGIIQSIYDCPTNTFFDPNAHRCKTYYTCPEITTIAPAIIREPTNCSEPGKFPIENTKCTKYLYCIMSSNGFLEQEIDCPQGSLFNPNTEKCSEAYRCPEDLGKIFQLEENQKIIPECTREGKFPVLGSNCGEYIFCTQTPRGLVGKTYQCPSKTKFDIDKHSCFRNTPCEEPYKIQNDTKCTAQEKLPILGTDCTKFLLCTKTESGFVSTEHTCHEGSLFNPLREQCSTSHVCNEDVKTKCTTIGLYPDFSDDKCEHYYECIEKDENIQGLRRKCKEGYAFDPEIQKCSASYKFHCRPRTRRDAFQQGLVSPTFLVNGRCTTTGRWLMDFTNCKNYVFCSFGGAGLIQRNFSCLGAVFDQQRQKCVNPATYTCPETVCNNNPLLLDLPNPNSRDCTTYISCEEVFDPSTGDLLGNRGVILYCPVNTRFNPETSACESTYVCPT